jgi:16S rRNA (guanine966-N2)-methyltransferase
MRVIAGTAKGTRLKVPPRLTRPSTDRLREALFSILAARLDGSVVLDLFAGSGALGIEALSRGAARARFVDSSWKAASVIRENLLKARLPAEGAVSQGDVFDLLGTLRGPFDLIFADPPYAGTAERDLASRLLEEPHLPGLLSDGGLLILEVEAGREPPQSPLWELGNRRAYGGSAILFYALREVS